MVEQEFDELFPGQVVAVQPVYDVRDLEPLDKEYDKLTQKLWDLVGDYSRKLRDDKKIKKRKQVGYKTARCRPCSSSVDSSRRSAALQLQHLPVHSAWHHVSST